MKLNLMEIEHGVIEKMRNKRNLNIDSEKKL